MIYSSSFYRTAVLLCVAVLAGCSDASSTPGSTAQQVRAQTVVAATGTNGTGLRLAGILKPRNTAPGGIGPREYYARLPLPPGLDGMFRAGDAASATVKGVRANAGSRRLPARILSVEESALVVGLRFEARILDYMLLEFFVRPRPAGADARMAFVRVPLSAIVNPTGQAGFVFRVASADSNAQARSNLRAIATPVVVIDRAPQDGLVTVLAELSADDQIIYQGHTHLLSGEEVRL